VGGELHIDGGAGLSSVRGVGHFDQVDGARRMDVRFDAEPVVLGLLTEQFPELGPLMGSATGPVTLAGGLDDLRVHADLATPAGSVVLDGRLALDGERPRYRAEGSVTSFEIHRVLTGIPDARLTARFELDGTGLEPATMDSRVNLNIFDAEVDGIRVDGGFVRAAAAHGRASLDTLSLTTAAGTITGRGTFGLASAIEGTLRFRAVADSLGALEPLLPPTALDTGFVGPRLAGEGTVDGVLTGSLERWSLGGDIALSGAALDHNSARRLAVRVDWAPGERQVTVVGRVDTLRSGHRELPGVQIRGRYARGAGELVLHATGPDDERLMLDGAFARTATGARYTLTGLTLDTNDGTWTLADSAVGDVGRAGIEVHSLVLERAADDARIAAAGVLPWSGSATAADDSAAAGFSASVRNLRIGELLRLAQSDTVMDGLVQGRFTVSGTAADPVMNASVSATGFRYGEATLDSVVAEVGYGDLQARGRISGWREGADIIGGEGYVPVDLALAERAERRLPRPMELRLRADSVPAGLVGFLAPGFRQVAGVLDGDFVVGGTPVDPAFRGELRLSRGAAYFDHSGVQYRDINAVATMRETLMALEGRLRTENGTGEVRGVLDLSEPTDPGFDLRVTAQGLDASRRRDVVAVAEGSAHLTGRYSRPVVSGQVRFTSGEMNLAEIRRQYEIVQLDPWFFEEVDASASVRPEEQNPFLANLRVTDA
ncbi:MAG TPA: translocation/assembly module TamB domain-containing protein, partial [Longimicrobiales bacterium]|nr:translocation/assembly module TamB domain-containing protein [Longimicrobiales bacterium]